MSSSAWIAYSMCDINYTYKLYCVHRDVRQGSRLYNSRIVSTGTNFYKRNYRCMKIQKYKYRIKFLEKII